MTELLVKNIYGLQNRNHALFFFTGVSCPLCIIEETVSNNAIKEDNVSSKLLTEIIRAKTYIL